jgi:tetratricopeptide (TPR) repeat protein
LLSVSEAHLLTLKSGEELPANEVLIRGDKMIIRSTVSGGSAEVPYPLELVEKIEFTLTAQEAELMDAADSGTDQLAGLRALWQKRLPFLSIPESDTGMIGLQLARLLVATQDKNLATEALALAATVRENDWKTSRQKEALGVRIAALAASGRIDEAMKEADALQSMGASDDQSLAGARVRSKFLEAELAWIKFQQLEADWPKWHLMPEKRVKRMNHLNRALDHYLFPVIAHPELPGFCAEGLVQAATIYIHLGKTARARACLEEVIDYFPDPTYLRRARDLETQLNQPNPTNPQGNSS